MHRILRETHKTENINLLKARDVYFDCARKQNGVYREICLLTPIVLSLLGTGIIIVSDFFSYNKYIWGAGEFFDRYLEVLVGITALIAFFAECIIALKISENVMRSNRLREIYDCKVLLIDENPFLYSELKTTVEEDLTVAKSRADNPKYEVWYRETFSDNEFANAICAMMDNVIYTYYIYAEYRQKLRKKLVAYAVFLFAYTIYFLFSPYNIASHLINPFILFLAVFDRIKDLVSSYLTSKELEETNKDLKVTVQSKYDDVMASRDDEIEREENKRFLLRALQDIIVRNRDNSLFVPKSIRDKYLQNGNPYYIELDEVKNLFWKGATV